MAKEAQRGSPKKSKMLKNKRKRKEKSNIQRKDKRMNRDITNCFETPFSLHPFLRYIRSTKSWINPSMMYKIRKRDVIGAVSEVISGFSYITLKLRNHNTKS